MVSALVCCQDAPLSWPKKKRPTKTCNYMCKQPGALAVLHLATRLLFLSRALLRRRPQETPVKMRHACTSCLPTHQCKHHMADMWGGLDTLMQHLLWIVPSSRCKTPLPHRNPHSRKSITPCSQPFRSTRTTNLSCGQS